MAVTASYNLVPCHNYGSIEDVRVASPIVKTNHLRSCSVQERMILCVVLAILQGNVKVLVRRLLPCPCQRHIEPIRQLCKLLEISSNAYVVSIGDLETEPCGVPQLPIMK